MLDLSDSLVKMVSEYCINIYEKTLFISFFLSFSLSFLDCGQMSAWYVLNALGFYPVNPASGSYMFGSPIVDRVDLQLPIYIPDSSSTMSSHSLTLRANGAKDHIYVSRVRIDGKDQISPILSHSTLFTAKWIDFEMSHKPETWFQDTV
jgi:putative alpha-1,2-mannosidase